MIKSLCSRLELETEISGENINFPLWIFMCRLPVRVLAWATYLRTNLQFWFSVGLAVSNSVFLRHTVALSKVFEIFCVKIYFSFLIQFCFEWKGFNQHKNTIIEDNRKCILQFICFCQICWCFVQCFGPILLSSWDR